MNTPMEMRCTKVPAGWVCAHPAGHDGPCAASPATETPSAGDASLSHGPAATPPPRIYGFGRAQEFDVELPTGNYVRLRRLTRNQVLKLNLVEVLDGFTPELLAEIRDEDVEKADEAAIKALTDPERNAKIFGPVDRVVVAACVRPKVVMDGETLPDASQYHIDDVELEDKLAIFTAAFGEQLSSLKSVHTEQAVGVRDVPEGDDVRPASE